MTHTISDDLFDDDDVLVFEDDEEFVFKDDGEDTFLFHESIQKSWNIMIVDDEIEVHQVTKLALQRFMFDKKPLNFISAYSGEEAKHLIKENPNTAIILLDVVMETNDAGLMVAKYIRDELKNELVRIILRTGQPGEAPEESVILDYDINDYKTKTELTQKKLFSTIMSGLRSYRDLINLDASQKELKALYVDLEERTTELRLLNQQLRQEIAERKQTQLELQKAKEVAEAANRAKSEFLATMSHELRTPLHAILGKSELLLEGSYGPLNSKQESSLRTVEQSGYHLLSLINDILDLAKIEAGKLELDIWYVPIKSVCLIALQFIQEMAQAKEIEVLFTLDQNVTMLPADERRLKQILINLLNNAVKFTPNQGRIGLEVVGDPAQKMIHFTVWDTGIGISSKDMERLFKPFVQLDSNLSRHYQGTGLGLSLVHRLTEMHGGRVLVESQKGQGSRFTISLPMKSEEDETLMIDNLIF